MSFSQLHTLLGLVVLFLCLVGLVSTADRCTPAPTRQGHWEWRGGSATAYVPGSIGSPEKFVPPDPTYPSPRHSSGSWQPAEKEFWLFGGVGAPASINTTGVPTSPAERLHDGLLNDLWSFSKTSMQWTRLEPALTSGVNRVGVYTSSKRVDEASVLMQYRDTINLTDVKRVETVEQATTLAWPGGRQNPATWISPLDGSLWMFGGLGYGASGATIGYLNDLWQFDKPSQMWFFRGGQQVTGTPDALNWPGARTGASSWATPDGKLWLFSGFGPLGASNRVRNDHWYFDLNTGLWNLVGGTTAFKAQDFRIDWITPRTDAIFWTPPGQLVWMYGGYGTTQTNGGTVGYLSDLWAWNTSSLVWTQIVSAAIPNIPGFIAERAGVPSGNNRSPARCCAASFMDSTGRLYFYGGYGLSSIANQPSSDTDFVADVWALETAPSFHDRIWTWIGGGVSRTPPAPVWPPYATNPSTMSVFESPSTDPSFPSTFKDPGNLPEYDAFVPPGDPPPPHPGARAWVTTWQLNSEEEAWIFGSIGTSPFSSMTQPAYFQDFWAFVFPPVTDTPTTVVAPTATKNLPVETIVWATVAGELFFVALAIILVWHRRDAIRQSIRGDKHGKPALTSGERPNSTEMKPMANGGTNNSHAAILDNKGGAVFAAPAGYPNPGISGTTTTTSGTNPASYSSGSVPSMNSSSVTFPSGSGPFTRSSRSKSAATTGTTTTTSGASIVTSPVTGAVMGRSIHASFDLVIRKKDLEFGNIIGRGSSGTIYAGRWHEHRVAIKQLATEVLIGEREGALQEARLVSQLRPHPNVIQIFGVCVTKQHVFIIMAKMHSSLDKLIYHVQRRKWLTVERTYRMAMGIVAGMLHLESQGICHRDLAARNVCLSKVGTPCIADFGMSRKLNFAASAAETVTQMGPVAWMAPECFLQKYSSKSDVWSFGIVLYEMLSGSVPHRGTDLHTLAVAIRDTGRTPSPIPSDADPGLVAIMQSCWAYDPNERPTFAQIFKQLRDLSQSGVDESEDIDFYQEEKLPTSAPSSSSSRKYERSKIRVTSEGDASTTPSTTSPKPTTSSTSIPKSGNSSGENVTTSSFPYSTESGASSTTSSSSGTSDPNHNSDSSAPPPFNPSAVSKLPAYPSPFSPSPLPSPVNRVASPPPTGHGDYVTGF